MKLKHIILQPKNITDNINIFTLFTFLFTLLLFIILSFFVVTGQLINLDNNLLNLLQDKLPSWFKFIAQIFYFIGEAEVAVFVVLFSLIFLVYKNMWEEAQIMALSCLSVLILIDKILKPSFAIIRPIDSLIDHASGYSYPSGHGAGNLLLYLLISYFISIYIPRLKVLLFSLSILVMILMGISSAFLRVHWISDFVASYMVGYMMFIIAITLYKSSKK